MSIRPKPPGGGGSVAVAPSRAIESVALTGFGHSYVLGQNVDTNTPFMNRLQNRLKPVSMTNRGIGGWRSDQVLSNVQGNWPAGTRGAALVTCSYNDVGTYGDVPGAATCAECFRAMLAWLQAGWLLPVTDPAFSFGSGWTTGATTTASSFVDVAFTGDAAQVRVNFTTAAGGTLTASTGETVNVGGWKQNFSGVLDLKGHGPGDHVVRLTVTGGTPSVTITGLLVPNPNPPLVMWLKEAPAPAQTTTQVSLLTGTYLPAMVAVAATFPGIVTVDMAAMPGYGAGIYGPDGIHPNDLGHKLITDAVEAAVNAQVYAQGLNMINALTIAGYTGPAVIASGAGSPFTIADTFNRANGAIGSTDTGALAWVNSASSTWVISSNTVVNTVPTGGGDTLVSDSHSDGTLSVALVTTTGVQGLAGRCTTDADGYLFYIGSGIAQLKKRTGTNAFTTLSTSPTMTLNPGDVLSLVMSGSTLIGKVNGVTVCRAVDATYTGTKHGLFNYNSANAAFDNFSWTNNP
jgi:hypothetical protein